VYWVWARSATKPLSARVHQSCHWAANPVANIWQLDRISDDRSIILIGLQASRPSSFKHTLADGGLPGGTF
jgi:hypothetical protein